MKEIERMKREILESYPRLSETSSFAFACHPGISCFAQCCADVNIYLTPYDILQLKKRLGISSGEFLSTYTVSPPDADFPYPVVLLRMMQDRRKSCPLLGDHGCSVYPSRPAACRMYPLGGASPATGTPPLSADFYFLMKDESCRGLAERKTQTIAEWLDNQGMRRYDEWAKDFKTLTLHQFFQNGERLPAAKASMFRLACYDVDGFREFVFNTTFLQRFAVDDDTRECIKQDDLALLRFGQDWLRFALFGEKTLRIRNSFLQARNQDLENGGAAA